MNDCDGFESNNKYRRDYYKKKKTHIIGIDSYHNNYR